MYMKVVIVDDEWYGLDVTYRLLTQVRQDLEVVAFFQDPQEALERIPALQPDLVILDMEMPYLSGMELYHKLKSLKSHFLVISAHGEGLRHKEGLDDRVRFMSKPFSKSDMTALLNTMDWTSSTPYKTP